MCADDAPEQLAVGDLPPLRSTPGPGLTVGSRSPERASTTVYRAPVSAGGRQGDEFRRLLSTTGSRRSAAGCAPWIPRNTGPPRFDVPRRTTCGRSGLVQQTGGSYIRRLSPRNLLWPESPAPGCTPRPTRGAPFAACDKATRRGGRPGRLFANPPL